MALTPPEKVPVEDGWDRTANRSAAASRLPIADDALDINSADLAARLRNTLGISPADARIGAVLEAAQGDVSILTSDVDDLRRIVEQTGHTAAVVRL